MLCVLMPVHNGADYIEQAIHSVFSPEPPIETLLLIADDGSTDATAAIVRALMAQNPHIRLYQTENHGVSAARNHLISCLPQQADFVMFLDADDCFPADRIARDIAVLQADPSLDLVFGELCIIKSKNPDLRSVDMTDCPRPRHGNVSAGSFRRRIIDATGGFDTSFTHGEDLDYLLRMFEQHPKARILDEVSTLYRKHAKGATSDQAALQRGVLKATLFHIRRRRDNPELAKVDTLFTSGP